MRKDVSSRLAVSRRLIEPRITALKMIRIFLPVVLLVALVFLACQSETGERIGDARETPLAQGPADQPDPAAAATVRPTPSTMPLVNAATASPTNFVTQREKSQSVLVTTHPRLPTPNPSNTPWVRERLDAVVGLYGLSQEGAALVGSLDLRQTRGDPGFFGSYGF